MSSSAFFIEAAAKIVRLLSCASAGEKADPHRMVKPRKIPARRCMVALRSCSRRYARKSRVEWVWMRQAEAPFRHSRGLTARRDIADKNHNRLRALVKGSLCLLGRQDGDRHRIFLGAADLQHERTG